MWECLICGKQNEDRAVACQCGYDESKNYGRYLVLTKLTDDEIKHFEEIHQTKKIGKEWLTWMDSVKDAVCELEEEDASYLLEQMKDSFAELLQEIRAKDGMVTSFVIGPESSSGKCGPEIKEQWLKVKGRMDEGQKWNYEGNRWYFGVDRPQNFNKAIDCYNKAKDAKNLDAINNLGNCYFYGNGTLRDWNRALEYYKIASNVGHAQAIYNMGYCYQFGKGIEKDDDAAFGCYMMAADSGIKEAQRSVGNYYFSRQNMYKAVEWYEKAANAGDVEAQRSLGYCYRYGEGVKANLEKAVEWYKKAAEQNDTISLNIIGDLCQSSDSAAKNMGSAKNWYRKASANLDDTFSKL